MCRKKNLIFIALLILSIEFLVILIFEAYHLIYRSSPNFIKISKEKWIVVTSISEPTEQIKKLSKINAFQLLVIGDVKTNDSWYQENVIFLSVDTQKSLGLDTFKTTPLNSYTRKNIGYLFAIRHGAKFIYDTDDDNAPLVDLDSYFSFDQQDMGLTYDCNVPQRLLNPYAHFGQPFIWPRGYPLTEIKNNHNNSYVSGKRKVSIIQQGVVNGDPDVDAIFRLTKSMQYNKIDLYFDDSSPSFQIPLYKMSPYNSQNTLISYNGFWSLYLPKTVTFRLTDIWRSYWAQRLMWLLNETVSFNGPNAYQLRNSHSYLKDFQQESNMYLQTEKFIEFLFKWRCKHDKFYDCMIQISTDMSENGFWQNEEIESIKNWIKDLNTIGYIEPKIIYFEHNQTDSFEKCSHDISDFGHTRIRYTPEFQKPLDFMNLMNNEIFESKDQIDSFFYFDKLCKKFNVSLNTVSRTPIRETYSILITFNHEAKEAVIMRLSNLYKNRFKNVIFCGSKLIPKLSGDRSKRKEFDSFTFIEMVNFGIGSYHYFCMNKAIEMGFKTNGFMLLSDDVMFKYWNFRSFDQNKIWYPFEFVLNHDPSQPNGWVHWGNSVSALNRTWLDLESRLNNDKLDQDEKKIIKSYFEFINENQEPGNSSLMFSYNGADIFYVPRQKFKNFYYITNAFRLHRTYLEIAVPMILAGLGNNRSLEIFIGHFDWHLIPLNFELYQKYVHFFHPFKLSNLLKDSIGKKYCSYYLNDVFVYN